MATTSLEINREGRVLRLTLNRPEKRNALNAELCRALVETMSEAQHDSRISAILLGANGDVFCSGMDLNEAVAPDAVEKSAIHESLFTIAARVSKPIVAAVRGKALAGGMGLVANAHIVVTADNTNFGLTEIRIAMWPYVVFRAVASAIGERRAVELSLTGRTFGAGDALAWGLAHYLVAEPEVDSKAAEIATALSRYSPKTISQGLGFVLQSRGLSVNEAARLALTARAEAFQGADFAEGVRAFKEKRPPKWHPG